MLLAGDILLRSLPTVSGSNDELVMNEKDVHLVLKDCDKASCSQPAVLEEIRVQLYSHAWVRSVQPYISRFRHHGLLLYRLVGQFRMAHACLSVKASMCLHPLIWTVPLPFQEQSISSIGGVVNQYHGSDEHASSGF
jgi:hypothetical protein